MSPTPVAVRDADPPTDAHLLAKFVGERDGLAFALLVRRHAGLVYGVCRRVLRNPADADDAFQAVFLVLLRKADGLTVRATLCDWLHAVAVRVAMKARTAAARRRRREDVAAGRRAEATPPQLPESLDWFDRELAALPVRYREPVVLCLVQERSREEAAAALGIPEGTLASRRAYARKWLAERLGRRGMAIPAALAAVVPAALLDSTAAQANGAISTSVHQLATGAMRAMLFTQLRVGVLAAVGLAVLAGGLVFAAPADKPGEPPKAKAPEKKVDEPEWMAGFRKAYQLKEGEYVKRVAPPFVPERDEYMYGLWVKKKLTPEEEERERAHLTESRLFFVLLMESDGDKLTRRMCVSVNPLQFEPKLRNADCTMTVWDAVAWTTGLDSPVLVVHPEAKGHFLLTTEERTTNKASFKGWPTVGGDFVVRKGAPLEKLVPQLETILRDECELDVRLTLREEEQDVYVVGGKFKLAPNEWRNKDEIDVYASEEVLNKKYEWRTAERVSGGVATRADYVSADELPSHLGRFLNVRVVADVTLPADVKLYLYQHTSSPAVPADRDPEKVLKNVSEQTGLTFKKEKRKVPVLELSVPEKK
jgi:RNA polymerase sigma factor (sigma-70 family)